MSGSNNPQVSVFHFTSRISSAKIKKYKLATERGMAGGNFRAAPANHVQTMPSPSAQAESSEPPAKKPKLKLRNSHPDSPETIAVARPHRDSSLRIRYSENMVVDEADLDDESAKSKPKPSPAASSDLSTLTSTRSIGKEPTPATEASAKSSTRADYSRDFMSYYVDGIDDDEDELAQPAAEPVAKKPDLPKPAPVQTIVPPAPQAPPRNDARFKHHMQPTHPQPRMQPQNRLPPPQPSVQLIDNIKKIPQPKEPLTVAVMIGKLEALSTALTNFGGVPAVPKSPPDEQADLQKPQAAEQKNGEKKKVDDFLAMFDDGDSDDTVSQGDTTDDDDDAGGLNYMLENPGEPDVALAHGIDFIQNALKSWAQQRLNGSYTQHYMQERERLLNEAQSHRRGPGRPRKFDGVDDEPPRQAPPPLTIQMDLAKTSEGAAIAAFQEVLNCKSLQVNAIFPAELTRAMRHLYMQIDHLINQGARKEPPWQCMSYNAQITAQKIRVDKWKEAQAKAQEEMARQHHLAHRQMMEQMGIPQRHRIGPLTAEQAQREHAIELERRRSMQHAAQQPHLTQYLTNPMSLNSSQSQQGPQTATPGVTPGPAQPSPTNPGSASSPGAAVPKLAPAPTNSPNGVTTQSSPIDAKTTLERIKMYMPNYLPLSGHTMKFSFAPHSELALKTFGTQAFPPNTTGPNLPNRGPMNYHHSNNAGAAASPLVASKETPMPVLHAPSRSMSDNIDVAMSDAPRITANGAMSPRNNTDNVSAPRVLNTYHELDPPAPSATANPEVRPSIEVPNGVALSHAASPIAATAQSKDLASKFPHPGAVIIDQ